MREGATMAKMYQVDKMAIAATMATMAFQLVSKSALCGFRINLNQ